MKYWRKILMNREEKLLDICADVMNVDRGSITLKTSRNELGEFDSLSIIQILTEMEDLFQHSIKEETLQEVKIEKIGDFLHLLDM